MSYNSTEPVGKVVEFHNITKTSVIHRIVSFLHIYPGHNQDSLFPWQSTVTILSIIGLPDVPLHPSLGPLCPPSINKSNSARWLSTVTRRQDVSHLQMLFKHVVGHPEHSWFRDQPHSTLRKPKEIIHIAFRDGQVSLCFNLMEHMCTLPPVVY